MTTSKTAPTIVGHALYLELTRSSGDSNYTTQVIITPEGTTSTGVAIPTAIYRRRLSTSATRRQWTQVRATRLAAQYGSTVTSTPGGTIVLSKDQKDFATTDLMLNSVMALFESLGKNNYKLFKAPVVVEVVSADMDDIAAGKTPYKLLGRIWKARKALGFPAEYVHESVARTHPATTIL